MPSISQTGGAPSLFTAVTQRIAQNPTSRPNLNRLLPPSLPGSLGLSTSSSGIIVDGLEVGKDVESAAKDVAKSTLSANVKALVAKAYQGLQAAWDVVIAPAYATLATGSKASWHILRGSVKAVFAPLIILGRIFVDLCKKLLHKDQKIEPKKYAEDLQILGDFLEASPSKLSASFTQFKQAVLSGHAEKALKQVPSLEGALLEAADNKEQKPSFERTGPKLASRGEGVMGNLEEASGVSQSASQNASNVTPPNQEPAGPRTVMSTRGGRRGSFEF